MTSKRLLHIMGKIAHRLIKSNFITDFTVHDANTIRRTNGQARFIWQVRNTGTWLYLFHEQDWAERLTGRMDCYKSSGTSNIYYYYNKRELVPLFESDALSMAKTHVELRQKHILNNMSIREALDDAVSALNRTDSPYVKEHIRVVTGRAKALLEKGYDANAGYIPSWEEYTGHIL